MYEFLECFLPSALSILLGDVTQSPSKIPDAVRDVILPKLHQWLPQLQQ
jgi:hypothetical protein